MSNCGNPDCVNAACQAFHGLAKPGTRSEREAACMDLHMAVVAAAASRDDDICIAAAVLSALVGRLIADAASMTGHTVESLTDVMIGKITGSAKRYVEIDARKASEKRRRDEAN